MVQVHIKHDCFEPDRLDSKPGLCHCITLTCHLMEVLSPTSPEHFGGFLGKDPGTWGSWLWQEQGGAELQEGRLQREEDPEDVALEGPSKGRRGRF